MRLKNQLTLAITAATLASLVTNAGVAQAASNFQTTDAFLQKSFTSGQFVSGFTPGKPDFGFSLEGLLQRKALGETSSTLAPAIAYLLTNGENTGSSANPSGYLFDGGHLKLGLAGKWAFVSAIIGAKNEPLRKGIINLALSKIDGSGDIAPDASANTYDRAWLVLGLLANGRPKQAADLATNMAGHHLADGGFNDGFTLGTSSSDGTGITLQALAAAKKVATQKQLKVINAAVGSAERYLEKSIVIDHFEAYGDYNVNGTEYALMGLAANQQNTTGIHSWLVAKIASDGGLQTSWSGGTGDVYATAQGGVALMDSSYVALMGKN